MIDLVILFLLVLLNLKIRGREGDMGKPLVWDKS